jgi:hypothetical protein
MSWLKPVGLSGSISLRRLVSVGIVSPVAVSSIPTIWVLRRESRNFRPTLTANRMSAKTTMKETITTDIS